MKIGIGIAVGVVISIFILHWFYRRQVKKICRQLAFINRHDTNMKLQEDWLFSELSELTGQMNILMDASRQVSQEVRKNEEVFKDTITNISHDIRTPLTSLDGYFQLLQKCDSEQDRERYIRIIQERISSLNDMLEELFTYTKLQNDNYELALEAVDFGKIVYDTVFSFYDDFQTKEIEPEITFVETPLWIWGNREAARRVLQNIVKNAMEHGSKELTLRLYTEEKKVIFECENDVVNAEEIHIEKVFTRFYKADSARTQSSTGLGLSIAKGLVEKMGGVIEAEVTEQRFGVRVVFGIFTFEK